MYSSDHNYNNQKISQWFSVLVKKFEKLGKLFVAVNKLFVAMNKLFLIRKT